MKPSLLVIASSTDRPIAIDVVLGSLPLGFPLPIIIVDRAWKPSRTTELAKVCRLPIRVAEDKDPLLSGRIHVAPPNYHLLVDGSQFSLSIEPSVCQAQPSVDVLLDSAAFAFGAGLMAVILEGNGFDGARGAVEVARRGGTVLVQDPKTTTAKTLLEATMARCPRHECMSTHQIAALLNIIAEESTDHAVERVN